MKLICDQMSLMYLMGTEVDYVEGLHGAGFKFNNPNVKSTCGCGSSSRSDLASPACGRGRRPGRADG